MRMIIDTPVHATDAGPPMRLEVPASTPWPMVLAFGVTLLFAGLVTWALVASLADFAFQAGKSQKESSILGWYAVHPAHLYAVFAVPTVVLATLAGMTLFIGLIRRKVTSH